MEDCDCWEDSASWVLVELSIRKIKVSDYTKYIRTHGEADEPSWWKVGGLEDDEDGTSDRTVKQIAADE